MQPKRCIVFMKKYSSAGKGQKFMHTAYKQYFSCLNCISVERRLDPQVRRWAFLCIRQKVCEFFPPCHGNVISFSPVNILRWAFLCLLPSLQHMLRFDVYFMSEFTPARFVELLRWIFGWYSQVPATLQWIILFLTLELQIKLLGWEKKKENV